MRCIFSLESSFVFIDCLGYLVVRVWGIFFFVEVVFVSGLFVICKFDLKIVWI